MAWMPDPRNVFELINGGSEMARHDPHSYSDLAQGKISHIDLRVKVDFEALILKVEAEYQLEDAVTGSLFLDTSMIDLVGAVANGADLKWEFDEQNEILGERLHLRDLDNISSFKLVFNTSSETGALQWLPAIQTAGGKHPFLYSQCALIHARGVLPCQDTPSVRFTYSVEVEVPKPLTAVVAAEQVQVRDRGANQVFVYRMPQRIPSYLFAFAVGNLHFRTVGPRTGVYAEPEVIESAAWEFAENEARIEEAERLLGPYLWERYDLLILPPFFPFGGMENPRLTFLSPTVILGNRGQSFFISHELAHAWTGNLITNATWEDFWLNEGWTTYVESRITEVLEGTDVANLMAVFDESRLLKQIKRIGTDSPLTRLKVPLEDQDPDDNITGIPYFKGSFFLKECEFIVGRKRFDAFISRYINSFQFQSLSTETFLDFLKGELPEVFENLDVQNWVYQPGLTEERHKPTSRLYDEVQDVLDVYQNGTRPTKEQVADWHRFQVFSFLGALPEQIPVEDCQYLEDVLDLRGKNDPELCSFFYATCITSGYREILPRAEEFIGGIGRLQILVPIFLAMIASDWAKAHARRIVEGMRERHHKTTVQVINSLLEEAGL